MRLIAKLACTVWLAVIVTIAVSVIFWRVGYLRPHALWGIAGILAMFIPMALLTLCAGWRALRGPCRLRAIGWLLAGATPLVWIGAYFVHLNASGHTGDVWAFKQIAAVWVSSAFDIEARRCYSRWTHGRHAVLMDNGQTPEAERLVAEMDEHIESMASLLGEQVPDIEFPWLRGSLVGHNGCACVIWALCGQDDNPGELKYVDRHEVAHTLIAALSGLDRDPPSLLIEGWAQSQSSDRNDQISRLAEKRRTPQRRLNYTYSLQELVGPDWYGREESGPVYWEGGPLVHYLMERYSADVFFQLYSNVRRDSFHEDCQAILGDTWEVVEKDFWVWIEAEATAIGQPPGQLPTVAVEFADAVDLADWNTLVAGYRNANTKTEPFPTNQAFSIEREGVVTRESENLSKHPYRFELRAVFEDDQFWISTCEDFSDNAEEFLMLSKDRCAIIGRNENGKIVGWVKGNYASVVVRSEAADLLRSNKGTVDLARRLPLTEAHSLKGAYMIEEIVRPKDDTTAKWEISYTWRSKDDVVPTRHQLELDPTQRWWLTRSVSDAPGENLSESEYQYQMLNDSLVLLSSSNSWHSLRTKDEGASRARLRMLTKLEQQELRQRVEQAVRSGPKPPDQTLWYGLIATAIAWPLCVAVLMRFSRHRVTP